MKKITFLAAILMSVASFGQLLTHSTDNGTFDNGSVACASNPDGMPNTGDEGSSDNQFYRSYTPADFGVTGTVQVSEVSFYISFNDVGGTNPTISAFTRIFSTSAEFPTGTLTEVADQAVDVSEADNGTKITVTYDTPAVFDSADEIVVSLEFLDAPDVPANYDVRIGINAAGEDAPSYLSSAGCGIANPTATADIGFPDNAIILDILVEEVVLGINDNLSDVVSIFPNPTTDVLNVNIPSNVDVKSASLYDVLGKDTGLTLSNGTINTSNLARGVYILNITTDRGSLTEKIVKQ